MKEIEKVVSTIGEGLKSLAKGIEAIAEQMGNLVKTKNSSKPEAEAQPVVKPKAQPVTKSKPGTVKKEDDKKAPTAIETVYVVISKSRKGINMATLTKKTGFNSKKIANNIYKLKKQGRIKSIAKGIYVKT